VERIFRFERCPCGKSVAHGYFVAYNPNGGGVLILPIKVDSIMAGCALMARMAYIFRDQDISALEQQLHDVGLPETRRSADEDIENIEAQIQGMWRLLDLAVEATGGLTVTMRHVVVRP
jgi:hypothetical protein